MNFFLPLYLPICFRIIGKKGLNNKGEMRVGEGGGGQKEHEE
jgi:hypothetical protein